MARSAIGAYRRAPGAVGLRFPVSSRANPPTNSLQLTSELGSCVSFLGTASARLIGSGLRIPTMKILKFSGQ